MSSNPFPFPEMVEVKVYIPKETLDELHRIGDACYCTVNDMLVSEAEKIVAEYKKQEQEKIDVIV